MLNAIGQFSVREKRLHAAYDHALTTALFSALKLEFRTHLIAADYARACRGRRIDSQMKLVRLSRVSHGFSDRKKAQKKLKTSCEYLSVCEEPPNRTWRELSELARGAGARAPHRR
jgi:hypothetical protein